MAITIPTGKTYELNGVTYTATQDAVLNLDDAGKVSGLASGSVTAVVSGAKNSPTITFDGSTAFDFTCTQDDGALKVRYKNHSLSYTSGSVTYSSKGVTFPEGNVGLTGKLGKIIPFNINVAVPESGLTGIFDGDKFNLASTNTVTVAMTFPEEIKSMVESEAFKENIKVLAVAVLNLSDDSFEKLYDVAKQLITTPTTLNLSGEFTYDRTDKSFSFAQDSKLDISVLNYGINLAAVDGVLDGFSVYNEKTDDSISVGAKISPSSGNGKLYFNLSENGKTLFKDVLKINSGLLTIDLTNAKLSLDANSSLTMTVRELYTATIASTDAISATFSADANGNIVLTPDGKVFKVTLQRDSATIFDGTIQLSNGSLLFNQETHSITLTQGTKMTFTQNNNSISLTAKDTAGAQIVANENGIYTITPSENGGSVDVEIKQNGETIFKNNLSVKGSISFNPTNRLFSLTDGTTFNFTFDGYTLTATADGNASGTVSFSASGNSITSNNKDGVNLNVTETADGNGTRGVVITPDTEDEGKLYLTLTGTSSGSLSAEIELLSGSFILGEDGTLSITKDTELQIKFSDDYIINFKAADDAGGVISLSDEGITFSPNSNDGGLQLSITKNGQTRSASLDVTGSVTYKLDGSISLAKGTVVRNVFEDGNILTITANTDASGSINFNPQTGLTIKPTTPDALTVSLKTGDLEIVNITSITGSITYSGGVVTASDGTEAQLSFFGTWEPKLYTTGGTASIQFTADRTIYTANEGATLVLDGNNDLRIEFENGSITDVYAENIGDGVLSISEGTTLRSNDHDFAFTLEKAGNYTLNGMSVTTTEDNVEVQLANYDTITFGQGAQIDIATSISGNDLDVVASATQGQGTVTVDDDGNITYDATNGTLQISVPLENVIGDSLLPSDFTISGGSVTMGATDADGIKTISIPQGTTISFTKNGMTFTGVTQNDINGRLWMRNGTVLYLHSYEEAIFDVTTTLSNTTTFNGTVTLGGAFSYNAANGTVGSVDSNTYNVHDSYIQIAVGNQTLRFTTNGETFFAALNVDDDGKITLDFINENYNSMLATVSLGGNPVLNAALVVNGSIVVDPATLGITLTKDTAITMTQGSDVVTITALDEAGGKVSFSGNVISFTPNENDGALSFVLVRDGSPIFGGTLNVTSGTISFDTTEQKFSFTKGTKVALGIGISELEIEVTGDDAGFKMAADAEGNITITPDTDDGSLDITFKRNGEAVLQNNVSVNGSMIFNPTTRLLTLVDGTTVNIAFDNYTLTATADGDASSEISLTASGIAITPQTGDGKLNLTLTGTSSGSLSASIEVLSGGFVFGTTGALTVTEGTELQIDFGDGYIINFKATDAAGGAISLGADGITFAPNSDDGNLQLTITRDGQTRSASLDVTGGSVTYKLDGSISLTKGTVVRNVFEDGNILTITANTDASGSITFNPQTGLTIAPTTADALNVVLTTGNLEVVNISSITGSITYSGGVITASDGTRARILYYFGWESDLYTTGGTASIQFTDDRTIYTANEGSTFAVDYLDGTTLEIENGTYSDIYATETSGEIELISEGSTFRSNDDEAAFTLEKAGNYTLNGMAITTSQDNTQVVIAGDYNTVTFEADAGITFNGQEFSGDGTVTLTDGNITFLNTDDNATVTGTAIADSISNSGEGVTITALAGNDTITNTGASAIINGGAGDDLIQIDGDNVTIEYSAGNDTITGFDETSTLSIGDNVYSTQQSGDDLIITVGESKITLVGAASLSAPNIESTNPAVELIETILKRTALGYPVMAAIAFHPEEYHSDEPTNYSNKEDWTITSADNLELHAVHYTPENSNDKWVVLVHGYGHNHKHMYPFAGFYLANGYNVLMVDQRTAGDSEGTWLTMGAAEGADVALWTQEIARRNSNAKITLHGVSMGSATAMLAAARSDAVNVTSLIEDCGYTSAMDVFYLLNEVIVKAPNEVIAALDLVAEGMTGYYLHDAAPINSISSAKMPTLFISGDSDSVVPISMLASLYEASGAEVKEEFLVKGVGHGRAGLEDPIGYSNAVFRFVAEANGEGWDTANIADDISLRGTKYNDTIANSGDGVTINTGAGDDIIQLDGDNVRIQYSAGNDTINGFDESTALQISGEYATATSGDNVVVTVGENAITLTDAATLDALNIFNDTTGQTINNIDDNTLISGGNGDDSISNIGDDVTINSGVGNDSIYNTEGKRDSINAGTGNDTILNDHAYYPTIEGGAGDDLITIRRGHYTNIDGGTGNDTILGEAETTSGSWAMGGYATINGGAGDDYIDTGSSDSASIMGGKGADTIITSGNDATINGGAGDDIISLHGASVDNNIIEYETGSGNDIIYGLNSTGTISISSGAEYSTAVSGDDVILTVGENTITVASTASVNVINYELAGSEIENTTNNTLVSGTRFNDTISNEGSNVTINASAGNDVIQNHGANSSVNGGTGADSITNMDANGSTIEGDYGDDVILNNSDNVLINGSYGNDTLSNSGANVTIASGSGNDYIYNGGASAVIEYSGGMDTVVGFNETSTLSVGSDFSNDDVVEGTKDVYVFRNNYFVNLKDAMLTTDSINVNGEAIALSKFISLQGDSDSVEISRSNVTVDAGDGENLITLTDDANSNNIVLSGNTTVEGFKTGFGDGTDTIYINGDPAGVEFKDGGLTFGNSTDSLTLSDITTTEKINIYHERRQVLNKGVFIAENDWHKVEDSDLTVNAGEEVYFVGTTAKSQVGVDFGGISSALNVTMDTAYEDSEDFVPGTTTWINSVYSLKGGAGNTTITGSKNSDTIIAGTGETTINAAAGDDIISLGSASALVQYSSGEGNDIIQGFNENSTLSINDTYTTTTSGNDVIVNVGEEAITLTDAATLSSVNIFEGDLPLNTVNVTSNVSIVGTEGNDSIQNEVYANNVTIQALGGDDTIYNNGSNVTIEAGDGNDIIDTEDYNTGNILINAGAGNDSIRNWSDETTINAGEGDDSIRILSEYSNVSVDAGAGNDYIDTYNHGVTVTGGTGDDSIYNDWNFYENAPNEPLDYDDEDGNYVQFNYTAGDGNDVIYGFNETDTLNISGGSYSTTKSGDDLIITVDDGKITLAGGATLETVNIVGEIISVASVERAKQIIGADSIQTVTGNTYKVDNDKGNNLVYVDKTAKGSKAITLGNGGDAVLVEASRGAKVSITGGTGDDSLLVTGNAPITFDMSKGADKITPRFDGENVTLKGYKASLGGGIVTGNPDTESIVSEVVNDGNIIFGDGVITIKSDEGTSSKFTFADNTNATGSVIFNMFDKNGEKQAIGFTNSDGGKLDVSKQSDNYLLVGNYYDDKYGGSTLRGGKGNDTLLGGEGDVLNAGGGNDNRIILQNNDKRGGADIILNSGKTTVQNFKAGFDDGDRVFGDVNDIIDFKFDGTNISVKTNNSWHGVLSDVGNGANFVNILAADANGSVKVAVAQENAVIAVEDEIADYYVGENSAVDFTNYADNLNINLGSKEENLGTGEVLFKGINQITASSGQTTLMGSAQNETLYAGTGTASLYGGGGKNYLANTSADKDGATTFFVLGMADGARNTISGFEFVTENGIADKIEIDTANNKVSDVRASGNDVVIEVSNRTSGATERALIQGAIGQNMQFSDGVIAQVNKTALTYDGTANYFVATENNAAINVNSDVVAPVSIWLDVPAWAGTKENTFKGDIRTIDASGSSVKAELAGNDANNTILAGNANTSLWGGNRGDDFMQGGAGVDNFYYTYGNGSDTISGTTSGDTVFLSQVRLDQISGASFEGSTATLNFTDGGKLTIADADKANYVVTSGEEMRTYRVENGGFVQN